MRSTARLAALAAGAVIAIAPTAALAAGHGSDSTAKPSTQPREHTTMPSDAKAYGVLCQGESKDHMKGEKGTAFSRCVTDMAKLNKGEAKSPADACKNEHADRRTGDKRAKGDKRASGDAFTRCVAAGQKLLSEKAAGGLRK